MRRALYGGQQTGSDPGAGNKQGGGKPDSGANFGAPVPVPPADFPANLAGLGASLNPNNVMAYLGPQRRKLPESGGY